MDGHASVKRTHVRDGIEESATQPHGNEGDGAGIKPGPLRFHFKGASLRTSIFIFLRNLALWIGGYDHVGGKFDGDYMIIYAVRRKPQK